MATIEHDYSSWSERQLEKIERQRDEQKREAAARFDQLHKEGAVRFGILWLQCNMALADLRDLDYLPENDYRINALISECAWKMCERIEALKAGE